MSTRRVSHTDDCLPDNIYSLRNMQVTSCSGYTNNYINVKNCQTRQDMWVLPEMHKHPSSLARLAEICFGISRNVFKRLPLFACKGVFHKSKANFIFTNFGFNFLSILLLFL